MKVKISVTQDHINLGVRHGAAVCPIARAVREQIDGASFVTVKSYVSLYSQHEDRSISYTLPNEARLFMERFDEGLSVQPFEFEMEEIDVQSTS